MSWGELVNAALIGAGRAMVPPDSPALAGLTFADEDREARLLQQAAAMSRARRAGYRPHSAASRRAPEPAEPDDRPPVSLTAEAQLGQILTEERFYLVAEWLRLLATSRQRPPDALVPALLTAAARRPELREPLTAALGPLAGWLANFNDEWDWFGKKTEIGLQQWETADSRTRSAILAAARRADPAAGRDLVESSWTVDSFRDRAAFVAGLRQGLSLADEPFLTRALDDKRAEVRQAAAGLLAQLPESDFAYRAAQRAVAAVSVRRGTLRSQLIVVPPDTKGPDPAAGGTIFPPLRGAGAKAAMLQRVVAATPARFWIRHTRVEPQELLRLAATTDWSAPLIVGWSEAAIRDRDVPWLHALLQQAGPASAGPLFAALPAPAREDWLSSNPGSLLFGDLLEHAAAPWSARLSSQVRQVLARVARQDPRYSPGPRAMISLSARRLEPPEAPDLDLALVHDRLRTAWNDLLTTLSIRAAMRRELTEPHT